MKDIESLKLAIQVALQVRQQKVSEIRQTFSLTISDEQLIRAVDKMTKINAEAEEKVMIAIRAYLAERDYSIARTY